MKAERVLIAVLMTFIFTANCACQESAGKIERTGWQELFNGKDLTGWVQRGGEAKYFVEDGCIVGETVNDATRNTFLCTEKTYCDFVLECQFRIDPELNSGVQFRSETKLNEKGRDIVFGYQVDIDASEQPFLPDPNKGRPANLDENGNLVPPGQPRRWTGGIYDEGRRGWLYPLNKDPKARAALKQGEWNHIRIEAVGDSIKTWVNDVPVTNLKDSATACGLIGLQVHRLKEPVPKPLQVRFKNIRIKDLCAEKKTDTQAK